MSVLIVGSIALDNIKTQTEERMGLLGGSASFASLAASFFAHTRLVGIVGTDFPAEHIELFKSRGIDLKGLQIVEGKTFSWSGEYEWDMNNRRTLSVSLNVFESFRPEIPSEWRTTPFVLLANIHPSLQHHVLDQIEQPRFVVADTMDLWIETARTELERLLQRVDLLILNDSEARQLINQTSLIRAGRLIRKMGPKFVVVKKGEHGALLFGEEEFFSCGAYPLEDIHDPTGAGDCFAGGLIGSLAGAGVGTVHFAHLRKAVVHGSVIASFNVESFSVERLRHLTTIEIAKRFERLKHMAMIEAKELASR